MTSGETSDGPGERRAVGGATAMDVLATIHTAGHRAAARDLRRLARERLVAAGLGLDSETLADVELCVDELVANAVAHTASGRGGQVSVSIEAGYGIVRIAVIDGGGARTRPQVRTDLLGEGGRGLWLVEELSARWGADARPGGHGEVWAEFRIRGCGPPGGPVVTENGGSVPAGK